MARDPLWTKQKQLMINPPPSLPVVPAYWASWSWAERKAAVIAQTTDWLSGDFTTANVAYVAELVAASGENARLHVVFNVGADALRSFALHGGYKNVYEGPVIEGKHLAPSCTRKKVDAIIDLVRPEEFYFCALSLGGTGMRFYGEYCVVLKSPDDANGVKKVLDRNSYDFLTPPLAAFLDGRLIEEQQALATTLMCNFRSDAFCDMLSIKVLQHHAARPRLLTFGAVGEAVLSDEDYVEAYHHGKILRDAVLEVRSHPEDEVTESSIEARFERGETVNPEELQWAARRQQARQAMTANGIRHRVVTGNGRGRRWK